MITVKHPNGLTSTYDDTLQPGDVITTYNKGFFEFVKSEDRKGTTPLFHYRLKYDIHGKPRNGKVIQYCDASYCHRASEIISKLIAKYEQSIIQLKNIH